MLNSMMAKLAGDLRDHPSHWALALLFVLLLAPGMDFALSGAFYLPGKGFSGSTDGFLEFVRTVVPDLIIGSFVLCVVLWIAGLFDARLQWRLTSPRLTYLLLTLLTGPGLIVEALLKPHWGRARPKDVLQFGGDAAFTPPWQIAEECERNCSFVSGHAAVAFWVTAYALLLPPRWRAPAVFAGTAFGLGVGLVRVAQGAHFFTDIVAAGIIVLLVNAILARLILKPSAQP